MQTILVVASLLLTASALVPFQYLNESGTRAHAARGVSITLLSVLALGVLEYALWTETITLDPYLPLLIGHLCFAIPMLAMIIAAFVSGCIAYRIRVRPENELYAVPHSIRIHHFVKRFFVPCWVTTIITGTVLFFTAAPF
ncbi:MAG: hypothetical protein Q8Q39_00875 [bacterium]|nr:hypothetical protein [bacterium]